MSVMHGGNPGEGSRWQPRRRAGSGWFARRCGASSRFLKPHRGVYSANVSGGRTPSSLITMLATLSYRGEGELVAATMSVVQRVPSFIENRNGTYWVANPHWAANSVW